MLKEEKLKRERLRDMAIAAGKRLKEIATSGVFQ